MSLPLPVALLPATMQLVSVKVRPAFWDIAPPLVALLPVRVHCARDSVPSLNTAPPLLPAVLPVKVQCDTVIVPRL